MFTNINFIRSKSDQSLLIPKQIVNVLNIPKFWHLVFGKFDENVLAIGVKKTIYWKGNFIRSCR